jgi:diguanylate cyclase (GGDEF)-like protein
MVVHHESSDNAYSIIDTQQQRIIPGGSFTFNDNLLSEISEQTAKIGNRQGSFTIGAREYLWVATPVFDSPLAIANIYYRDSNDITTFLTYISPSLGITLFISIWLSLWAAAILANLFQQLAEKNNQLEHQSSHDLLTQLPNRTEISNIVQQALVDAKKNNQQLLFCLIDIDALKEINDSLGHESGDILLNQVTQRLKHTLQEAGHLGRFGGNKFSIMIKFDDINNVENISQKLLENFEPVFEINGHSLYVRATLGIAIFPDHATGAQELIQKAETALHKARKLAVDFTIYDISQDNNSAERLRLTHDLRNAIRNEELQLHYQPQFNVRHNIISSVEALARWIHPQHGFIPPDTFIEIAEQTGLIQPLTDWVLRTAIKQCAEWRDMGNDLTVSVNLSARNLHDETLGSQISNLLNYWNVAPEKLCLEITETAMMTDPEHARKLLQGLDDLGVRLSIDDFGTGYSSLGYLKKLPVDELKVDKSFVLNMANDESDASIVRATISLAHDLGLEVVAEGVEDQVSQDALSNMGCEYIQGYHIARPMPHHELTAMLTSAIASNDDQVNETSSNTQPTRI